MKFLDQVKIYVNGHDETLVAASYYFVSGGSIGTEWYPNFNLTKGDVIIGKGPGDLTSMSSDMYWNNFSVHSFAVWKSALDSDEILSLYEAAIQYIGSGIISNPVRDYLNRLDNRPGAYPTIKRTGDSRRLGNRTPVFDDTSVRIFYDSINYSNVVQDFSYITDWETVPAPSAGTGSFRYPGFDYYSGSVEFWMPLKNRLTRSAATPSASYDLVASESSEKIVKSGRSSRFR